MTLIIILHKVKISKTQIRLRVILQSNAINHFYFLLHLFDYTTKITIFSLSLLYCLEMNKSILNVTALEGLIQINSFFCIATFLSIMITILFSSLENLSSSNVVERLLIGLALSFKSFFFAWLLALCLKLTATKRYMEIKDLIVRAGIMFTAFFSGAGFHFLMRSMKSVTGAKIAILSFSCNDSSADAIGCMVVTVYMALCIYFIALCHLVFRKRIDDPE